MLKFYLSLVRDIPDVLRRGTEAVLFWVWTIGAPVAVYFNPQLRKSLDTPEISRWFVVVPIAISVVYGLLRANYERFKKLEKDAAEARSLVMGKRERAAVRTALGNYMMTFSGLQQESFEHKKPAADIRADLVKWGESATGYVRQFFDGGEVALFNPTSPLQPDQVARRLAADGFDEHARCYLVAQHHAVALKSLIERFRS